MGRLMDPTSKSDDMSDVDLEVDLLPLSLLDNVQATDCFGLMSCDHDLHGSICMSRKRDFISPTDTFQEFVHASFVLGRLGRGWSWGQPFWYCVRQVFELGLKAAVEERTGVWPSKLGHNLRALLDELLAIAPGHGILRHSELVAFIERMNDVDPTGDGGRFHYHKDGRHALAAVCCLDAEKTLYFVDAMNQLVVPLAADVPDAAE